jgi:Putative Zn-dependent protease, contains TPR repeats
LVLEALADWSLQKKTDEGISKAIEYLAAAIDKGSSTPADFEQLATLLVTSRRYREAASVLQKGVALIPYDPALYQLLAGSYIDSGNVQGACDVAIRGNEIFPENSELRKMSKGCSPP